MTIQLTLPSWADNAHFQEEFKDYSFVQSSQINFMLPLFMTFNDNNVQVDVWNVTEIGITPVSMENIIVGVCDSNRLESGELWVGHSGCTMISLNNKPIQIERLHSNRTHIYKVHLFRVSKMIPLEMSVTLCELQKINKQE